MYGTGLKKLGSEWGLKPVNGMLCGAMQGFPVTMSEGTGYKMLVINVCMLNTRNPDREINIETLLSKPTEYYRIARYEAEGSFLHVVFHDNPGTMKLIREYVNVEMPRLRQAGFVGEDYCFQCEQPMNGETAVLYKADHYLFSVHDRCIDALKSEIKARDAVQKEKAAASSGPFAPFGAILGGLIGMIPWIILYVLGYIASLGAMLIALGASYGHQLFGGKAGQGRFILVVVLTLLLVPVAQTMGVIGQFAYSIYSGELQESWDIPKDALTPADTMPILLEILEEPDSRAEILKAFASELPLAYVFAAIGLWAVWKKLRTENVPKKIKPVKAA